MNADVIMYIAIGFTVGCWFMAGVAFLKLQNLIKRDQRENS